MPTDSGDSGADQDRQPAAGPSDAADAAAQPGPDPGADDPWRRPTGDPDGTGLGASGSGAFGAHASGAGTPGWSTSPPAAAGPPPYLGPPPTQPPPPGWRPPLIVQPATPRQLPAQDLHRLDQEERGARSLTLGVSMVAGAVVLVVSCLLCSRLFLL